MSALIERIREGYRLLNDYRWVVIDKDAGYEWDRYCSAGEAWSHANRANIYSQRTGTGRRYVVRYESWAKRMIMPGIRGVLGHYA